MNYVMHTLDTITNKIVNDELSNGNNIALFIPIKGFMSCSIFISHSASILRNKNIRGSKNLICIPVPFDIQMDRCIEIFVVHHTSKNTYPKYDRGIDYTYINYRK